MANAQSFAGSGWLDFPYGGLVADRYLCESGPVVLPCGLAPGGVLGADPCGVLAADASLALWRCFVWTLLEMPSPPGGRRLERALTWPVGAYF